MSSFNSYTNMPSTAKPVITGTRVPAVFSGDQENNASRPIAGQQDSRPIVG